jgi:hypothetical protein
MKFNINDTVQVELTDAGRAVLHSDPDGPPSMSEQHGAFQLWRLMQVFGPRVHNGQPRPFFEKNLVDIPVVIDPITDAERMGIYQGAVQGLGTPGPGGEWAKSQWARVPVSVEAFDRLNEHVQRIDEMASGNLQALGGGKASALLNRIHQLEAQHASVVSTSVSVRSFNERLGELSSQVAALFEGNAIQGQLLGELKGARVAHLGRIEALEREQQTWDDDVANYESWKSARLGWEHMQMDRIAQLEHRFRILENQVAGLMPIDKPIDARVDACPRTYPLDPSTAEDPCEDCGRDQRKHDSPRERSDLQPSTVVPPPRHETFLEQFQRIREETQEAAHDIELSKEDRARLARYDAHTPSGQLRHGYRPDGSIGYDGLDKAPTKLSDE